LNDLAKPTLDWEAIEREFRAGQLSVSEIGRIYGVSHTAILKKAKKLGWSRNLAQRVREEVSARLVSDEVSATTARETIEAAAERVIQLVREHRRDIRTGREAVSALVTELREVTHDRKVTEAAIEAETIEDTSGRRRAAMLRAVSLGSRATIAASLSVALKNLIAIERQAFALETGRADGSNDNSTAGLAERLDAAFQRLAQQ
jgi:hypothetical protein